MFVVHVDTVVTLRNVLWPLIYVYTSRADIRCSKERVSIVVVPYYFPYVVSLRMSPAFFTAFRLFPDSDDDYERYCSGLLLDAIVFDLYAVHDDAVSLFVFLSHYHRGLAPVIFDLPSTQYLEYSTIILSPPTNIDVPPIDFGVFVAIRSVEFFPVIEQLYVFPNEIVHVCLTESQVKFSVLLEEVVLTPEDKQCVIGSLPEGTEHEFTISLDPLGFFNQLTLMSKWVWLFKTVSHRYVMSFTFGLDVGCLICF